MPSTDSSRGAHRYHSWTGRLWTPRLLLAGFMLGLICLTPGFLSAADSPLTGRWQRMTPDPKNVFPALVEFDESGQTRVIVPDQEPQLGLFTLQPDGKMEVDWPHVVTGPFTVTVRVEKDRLTLAGRIVYQRVQVTEPMPDVDPAVVTGAARDRLLKAMAGAWRNPAPTGPRTLVILSDGRALINHECLLPRPGTVTFRTEKPANVSTGSSDQVHLEVFVEGLETPYFRAACRVASGSLALGHSLLSVGEGVFPDVKAIKNWQKLGDAATAERFWKADQGLRQARPVAKPLAPVYREAEYLLLGEWPYSPVIETTANGPTTNLREYRRSYAGAPGSLSLLPDGRYIAAARPDGTGAVFGTYSILQGQTLEFQAPHLPGGSIRFPIRPVGDRTYGVNWESATTRGVVPQAANQRSVGETAWRMTSAVLGESYRCPKVSGEVSLPAAMDYLGLTVEFRHLSDPASPVVATLRKGLHQGIPDHLKIVVTPGTLTRLKEAAPREGLPSPERLYVATHLHVIIAGLQRLDSHNRPVGNVNAIDFINPVDGSSDLQEVRCLLNAYMLVPELDIAACANSGPPRDTGLWQPFLWEGFRRYVPDAIQLVRTQSDLITFNPAVQSAVWLQTALWDQADVDYFRSAFTAEHHQQATWKSAHRLVRQTLERRAIPAETRANDPVGLWMAPAGLAPQSQQADPTFRGLESDLKKLLSAAQYQSYLTTRLVLRADKTLTLVRSKPDAPQDIERTEGTWRTKGNELVLEFPEPAQPRLEDVLDGPRPAGKRQSLTVRLIDGKLVEKATGTQFERHDWDAVVKAGSTRRVSRAVSEAPARGAAPAPVVAPVPAGVAPGRAPMPRRDPANRVGGVNRPEDRTVLFEPRRRRIVVASRDAAPGLVPGAQHGLFVDPQINGPGQVAFVGILLPGSDAEVVSPQSIWLGTPGAFQPLVTTSAIRGPIVPSSVGLVSELQIAARSTKPSVDPRQFPLQRRHTPQATATGLRLNDQGQLVSHGKTVTKTTATAPSVIAVNAAGSRPVATFGMELKVNGQTQRITEVVHRGLSGPQGSVAVFARFDTGNNRPLGGLLMLRGTDVVPILMTGQAAPGVPDAIIDLSGFGQLTPYGPGHVAVLATMTGKSLDKGSEQGLWMGPPDRLTLALRSGTPVSIPGMPYPVRLELGDLSAVNSDGAVAVRASGNTGIFAGRPGQFHKIASRGERPGQAGASATFLDLGRPVINGRGEVAFHSTMTVDRQPGEILVPGQQAVWLANATGLMQIAATGDQVPGAGPGTRLSGIDNEVGLGDSKRVVFRGSLFREDLAIGGEHPQALFATDRDGRLHLVAYVGETVVLPSGQSRRIQQISPPYATGGQDGRARNWSDEGLLLFHLIFEDDSEAIAIHDLS